MGLRIPHVFCRKRINLACILFLVLLKGNILEILNDYKDLILILVLWIYLRHNPIRSLEISNFQ